jgi:lipoprotein-anchoring transpeptidase ErfK/SrfK
MRFRTSVVLVAGACTLVVLAGVGAVLAAKLPDGHSHPAARSAAVHHARPVPAVLVSLAGARGHRTLPWDRRVQIEVRHGRLIGVWAHDRDGDLLKGAATPSGWSSDRVPAPLDEYTAQVTVRNLAGAVQQRTLRFRTTGAGASLLRPVLYPAGGVVGVGQPVDIAFNHPVPPSLRAAVQRRMTVVTRPLASGAWRWMDSQDVHWRPERFWRPGTKVLVRINLTGLNFGAGVFGDRPHWVAFQIGASHISYVNVLTHQMTVTDNGRVVRTMPISAGRTIYPTMDGIHIALDKEPSVIMDSATVGIPRNSPNGYYETVYWDVHISSSGEYVHAAPWSVADQGITNVSHGCVNVSPANAQWFYYFSQPGDVVEITGSPRPPSPYDLGTEDWNVPWSQWANG